MTRPSIRRKIDTRLRTTGCEPEMQCSKVFERIITCHLMRLPECNDLLYPRQYDLRAKLSCETQLTELISDIHITIFNTFIYYSTFIKTVSRGVSLKPLPHPKFRKPLPFYFLPLRVASQPISEANPNFCQ